MKTARMFFPLLLGMAVILLQTGCSRLPLTGTLPEGLTVERLADIDEKSPMAVSPDGTVLAMVSSGLKFLHLPTRQLLDVAGRSPTELAWSPYGYGLAASYADGGKSTVVTYDQHGIKMAETALDGEVTGLSWLSETELLAASVKITSYKFGSNVMSVVHRWQPGGAPPKSIELKNTTLQPATAARWGSVIARGPKVDVSRTADQVIYLHPVEPPMFTPYMRLMLRDLASGKEMEIAPVSLAAHGGRFTADGELVIYGNGSDTITRKNPWTGETDSTVPGAGTGLEISPAGDYLFADGALYHDNSLLALLAPGGSARFAPDGRKLFVAAEGDLYLLTGLQPANNRLLTVKQVEKLLQFRAWRLDDLISPKDYQDALEKSRQQ